MNDKIGTSEVTRGRRWDERERGERAVNDKIGSSETTRGRRERRESS